jgi:hypothetical protein
MVAAERHASVTAIAERHASATMGASLRSAD